ncbi:TonB-dependent receptor [Paraflavitalea sp. CAU 1676]|uniref:TonB-dependent receptor n=1 Tax=Paraflavitalea sp. CAU 1676 TaxID=3032598 RepID=UPI0023DA05EB|nr:TonB-dependent receptor [Paraflavitalea sp. CAU 1676]MDF2189238.1 TonB-dependent receptor [Paraflavitalea sp. CAU 1676]
MQKLTLLLLILLVSAASLFAQQPTLKGTVIDTSEKKNLTNSVVALLRKSDSVLVTYSRTDKSGQFSLSKFKPGKYVLMVTHPAYADYMDSIEVNDASPVNLGNIAMILKSQLLQEVVVSHKLSAIRIKGDTIEYKADSFYMKAGSSVEDLLKKLPGLQVDRNGKITAQGETVQKVLVDGEEFFSDDPTIATRGLLSDAVDKVQVFDKASDQAAFTGIDDGKKVKTIDLKLKEDKKKGYFGKVELGSNGDKYWNNNFMLNAFKGKRKFSAFGLMSSTGKTGLDWQENMSYGGAGGSFDVSDGNFAIYGNDDDLFDDGRYWGEGLPKGWTAGIHFSNKWNEDKQHLNLNYKYNKLNTEASGLNISKYLLTGPSQNVIESGNNYSSRTRNKVDGIYDLKLDSLSSIKVIAGGSIGKSISSNNGHTDILDENGKPIRIIDQRSNSVTDNKAFNAQILYRKKFKKQGRTISINVQQDYRQTESTGFLYALNDFYDESSNKTSQLVDQQKLNDNITSTTSGRIAYTEPLSKRAILEFNYGIGNNHRQSKRTTLGKLDPNNPKYDQVVDSLSNDYEFNVLNNTGGINFRYSKPKRISFGFGANIARADFERVDIKSKQNTRYSFTNFFPTANVEWTMGSNGNIRFNYWGSTQAPTIDQIQPVNDNSDQTNFRVGNPDLKQAFRSRFNVNYNKWSMLSETSIWAGFSYSTVQNDFSSMTTITDKGNRITKPVNVNGNYNLNGYFEYGIKIKKLNANVGPTLNFGKSRNVNFLNGQENINNNYNVSFGFSVWMQKEKKYQLSIRPNLNYNESKTSLRKDVVTKFWTQSYDVDATVFLPWKLEIGSDVSVNIRQKTDDFDRNNNVVKWNGRLERKILKKDAGRIRFSAFDILNQNIGFNRSINSNFLNERTYDTFKRYFMLSLLWNFNKNGAAPNM